MKNVFSVKLMKFNEKKQGILFNNFSYYSFKILTKYFD